MFRDWLDIYKNIREHAVTKSECYCPECRAKTIDMQFVGDSKARIGYLDMWCTTCNSGIHMSRVHIPEGESMMSFEEPVEVVSGRIPNFRQVVPLD